jgi:hypothetical protein
MDAFSALRTKARTRRDLAIAKARDEFSATLSRIAALEQDLLGKEQSTHRTTSSRINSVIPTDQQFTIAEIMAGLEGIDPTRDWRLRTVVSHISRLRDKGIIRRIRRAKGHEPAIYARVDAKVDPLPFASKTLPEAVAEVMREAAGPLRTTEITVALLERGYRSGMTRTVLRGAIAGLMRRHKYKEVATGKWVRAAAHEKARLE